PRTGLRAGRQRTIQNGGLTVARVTARPTASHLTLLFQWVTLALVFAAVAIPRTMAVTSAARVTPVVVTHSAWQIHDAPQMTSVWGSGQPNSAPGIAVRQAAPPTF